MRRAIKTILAYLTVLSFCSLGMTLEASFVQWNPQIPSSISPFQNNPQRLAAFTGNNIAIYAHPAQSIYLPTMKANWKVTGKYYSAAVVVPTNSKNVARLLQNYTNYAGLFPTLKQAKILEQQGNLSKVKYSIHIPTPIPVLNFRESVTMQHQQDGNSISTLVLDAPIPFGSGKWEWFDLGDNQTLITITQWGDLNQPKGFLFKKILGALPEAKLGMPAGTNGFLLEALQRRFKSSAAQSASSALPATSLSSEQIQQVTALSQKSHEPVSFILPAQKIQYANKYEVMRFSTSYQYYTQTPEQLQQWLAAPAFQKLFPNQIKAFTIKKLNQRQLDADYRISVGLGVINIPFDFKMRFDYPNAQQTQFYATGGDLKLMRGAMSLSALKQGSLLNITSAMKIDDDAPLLLRAMRSMPYHEMLPAVGGNTVFALKVKQKAG
ncbi:MAG: SRPBCC family protein [Acinetobacter sp.]